MCGKNAHNALAELGSVDIAVNNAGLGGTGTAAVDLSEAEWDGLFDVNLKRVFFVCQAVAKPMIAQGHDRIINISSQAGREPPISVEPIAAQASSAFQ